MVMKNLKITKNNKNNLNKIIIITTTNKNKITVKETL